MDLEKKMRMLKEILQTFGPLCTSYNLIFSLALLNWCCEETRDQRREEKRLNVLNYISFSFNIVAE